MAKEKVKIFMKIAIYIIMISLVFIFFEGNGRFIYEGL